MALYKKKTTRALTSGAELFTRNGQRYARWRDRQGRTQTATVTVGRDGSERVTTTAKTWTAKYRDGQGIVREVATGCRDKQAAMSVLTDLEHRAELVKANVITATEDAIADHQHSPIILHIEDYLLHLRSRQTSEHHRTNVRGCLNRLLRDCGFVQLADLSASPIERWMLDSETSGLAARTRNRHLSAISAFANWCVETDRLSRNPFDRVAKANEKADRRRQRRAMTEDEIGRLLAAARQRPLQDALTVRRGARRGQPVAKIAPQVRMRLDRLGRERALIYKTLVLTGLRLNELASIRVGQCRLEGPTPHLELEAADEKSRQGALIPLRADLVAELSRWIEEKAESLSEALCDAPTVQFDQTVTYDDNRSTRDPRSPQGQKCQELTALPLFNVPTGLVRIFDRDLQAAGIAKVDVRGRTLDVHALRHTFGTLLSKCGVAPRIAQAAMRHSDIGLTMNVYTDPRLLDVHGALDALPTLRLDASSEETVVRATGTDDQFAGSLVAPMVAPMVAPNLVQRSHSGSSIVNLASAQDHDSDTLKVDASDMRVNRKVRLSSTDNRTCEERVKGLEPSTFSLGS